MSACGSSRRSGRSTACRGCAGRASLAAIGCVHAIEWADQLAQAELPEDERRERAERQNERLLRPTGAEIKEMDRVLEWLRDLREIDPGMALVTSLWALRVARHRSVKALCKERHWAPHTFYRKRAKALEELAALLNARAVAVCFRISLTLRSVRSTRLEGRGIGPRPFILRDARCAGSSG